MPARHTARQIAEAAEILRFHKLRDVLEVEYLKDGRIHRLTRIRFGQANSGRPTKRTMECLDDGREKAYDRKFDFEVVAFFANGVRLDDIA